MDIRYKLFPYPVLAQFSDDYSNVEFDVSVDPSSEGYNLRLDFMASLTDTTLMKLIEDNRAVFAYHLECAQTAYRFVLRTNKKVENLVLIIIKIWH